jgi:succinyl-CoA synthetase beta subunit
VAKEDPTAIIKMPVSIDSGLSQAKAREFATEMGFTDQCVDQAAGEMVKLYNAFRKTDATLLEINPMAEDNNGKSKRWRLLEIFSKFIC